MNKQQFYSLKLQLTDHHRKGIGNPYTADPLFLVRVKKIDWGYEEEYAQHHCIYFDDTEYHTVEAFIEDHDLTDPEELECYFGETKLEQESKEWFINNVDTFTLDQLWEWLEYTQPSHEYQYLHGNERWETINWFITRQAAEDFVKSKGGDPDVNIWVDCLYRSQEFQSLLDAVIDGKLVWKEDTDET